jgi:hypothetical protein
LPQALPVSGNPQALPKFKASVASPESLDDFVVWFARHFGISSKRIPA